MRSRWNCLVVGSCNVFGLALLVLSATGGGSAVRAEDPATLPGSVLEKIAAGIEQRVADLQASVASFADSFAARRIAAQELCVGDGSGAQTCITKAQLDALLRGMVQTGQAPAAIEPDQTELTASADTSVTPLALVVPASETPPAIGPSDAPLALPPVPAGEGRAGEAAEALPQAAAVPEAAAPREAEAVAEVPALPETPAAAEAEAVPEVPAPREAEAAAEVPALPEAPAAAEAEAVPETTTVIPSAPQPTTEQPAAASSEPGAHPATEAIVPSQPSEPAGSIIAANAKSQSIITEERTVRDEDPAQRGSMETTSAPPEVMAAPAEAAPASQRAE
jgi:hypothetical protein